MMHFRLHHQWYCFLFICLVSGCLIPLKEPVAVAVQLPHAHDFRRGNLIFHSDADISKNHPLFLELASFPEQVCRALELPVTDKLIHVYLFKDRISYEQYIHFEFKDLPSRRALFVKRPGSSRLDQDQLQVLCFWGDRIQDDLRHELTHATLHAILHDLPLWLDEGLAMYFEPGIAAQGINTRVLNALEPSITAVTMKYDFPRLESLKEVSQMSMADYQEVWAWVHYLMHSSPLRRSMLTGYLKERLKAGAPSTSFNLSNETTQLQLHLKQLLAERSNWPHG
ncbi:MAG: hypothetical protein JNJ77_13670 [Planctomycetia bacterium]|nr:hypothetical protein [Planctomycetia bacterium]